MRYIMGSYMYFIVFLQKNSDIYVRDTTYVPHDIVLLIYNYC